MHKRSKGRFLLLDRTGGVVVDDSAKGGRPALAMLNEAHNEAGHCRLTARIVDGQVVDVEAAGQRVGAATVAGDVEAGMSAALEGPPLGVLIRAWTKVGSVRCCEAEVPKMLVVRRVEC